MKEIPIPNAQKNSVRLVVKRVDNRAVFTLNGQTVYDRTVDTDPPLDDVILLAPHLISGINPLNVQLYNLPNPAAPNQNPWHIYYQITIDANVVYEQENKNPGPQIGLVFAEDLNLLVS